MLKGIVPTKVERAAEKFIAGIAAKASKLPAIVKAAITSSPKGLTILISVIIPTPTKVV